MADENEQNPVDQLIDLFVYAPVGLLYEYQEVIPKLVRRGKSQVQIARVVGQLAINNRSVESLGVLAEGVAAIVARQIGEVGSALGLTPPPGPPSATRAPAAVMAVPADPGEEGADQPLPIAGYDELTAKEIIGLLDELDPRQLERIRAHEEANRGRKTVLGKLERLRA